MAEGRSRRAAVHAPASIRIGLGVDLHPLQRGRRLVLGGVVVPHDRGLGGHSDADVLSHAICDALLGALGLPDLGARFPDDDVRNRGRSSLEFLREVGKDVRTRGAAILNVDAVILAEEPRLAPHLSDMRARVSGALACSAGAIGIRVKRFEGLGAIGRGEGIMAQAAALISVSPGAKGRAARPGRGERAIRRGRIARRGRGRP